MIDVRHYISQEGPNGESHLEMTKKALEAGVDWVQLRVKGKPLREVKRMALASKDLCEQFNAKLIINDHVELAKEIGADGVHVGLNDMTVAVARRILGDEFIIGGTANKFEDVKTQYEDGADYVGVGPYRFTLSKDNLSPVLGLKGYEKLTRELSLQSMNIPVLAIGGIQFEDIKEIMNTGVHGIAVASLINQSDNPTEIVNEIKKALTCVH